MSIAMEQTVMRVKGLYPNVDFFAASVYHALGIPTDLFTPVFAISRMSGWTAHVIEQHADNRLIRPDSEYIGERISGGSRSATGDRLSAGRSRRAGTPAVGRAADRASCCSSPAFGIVAVTLGHWRRGIFLVGVAAMTAAVLRLVLRGRDAGLLVVRSRAVRRPRARPHRRRGHDPGSSRARQCHRLATGLARPLRQHTSTSSVPYPRHSKTDWETPAWQARPTA